MKKRFFCLILCIAAMLPLSSCQDWQDAASRNKSITGEWYSEEIGGIYSFGDDNIFRLKIDISDTMTIDSAGVAHRKGSDEDYSKYCSYDGENFIFNIDGNIEMINMKRKDGINKDSAFGSYTLISGYIYDDFVNQFGEAGDKYGIIVEDNRLIAEIQMCKYSASDGKLIFSGEDLSFFGAEKGGDSAVEYTIQDDNLEIENGSKTLSFTKVTAENNQ